MTVERFIAEARSYTGVKFRHAGRTRRGVDCAGLIVVALKAVCIEVADRKDYGRTPHLDGLREALRATFGEPVQGRRPGDIALMRWHRDNTGDLYNHVGIVTRHPLGMDALLHALVEDKRVVEHRIDATWERRIVEVYRPEFV